MNQLFSWLFTTAANIYTKWIIVRKSKALAAALWYDIIAYGIIATVVERRDTDLHWQDPTRSQYNNSMAIMLEQLIEQLAFAIDNS